MQLAKLHWKKSRNSARFTEPVPMQGFRCRRGGFKNHDEYAQQLRSRQLNPLDPINA